MNHPLVPARPALASVAFLALLAGPALAQIGEAPPPKRYPQGPLLVSGYTSATVHAYEGGTGTFQGTLGAIPGAQSIVRGADGLLYIASEETDSVLRYREKDLTFVDAFVFDDPGTPGNETGGLDGPTAAIFGPTGDLFVTSWNTDEILRYDGASGTFLGVFVTAGSGGLDGPDAGATFGSDGRLYVPSFNGNAVLRYDALTGAFLDVFIPPGSGGLSGPRDLEFHGPHLIVSSWRTDRVNRYDAATGAYVDRFVSTLRPSGIAISPYDGDLYVTSDNRNWVLRIDSTTGARLGQLVPQGGGGLIGATFLYWIDR